MSICALRQGGNLRTMSLGLGTPPAVILNEEAKGDSAGYEFSTFNENECTLG